MNSAQRDAFLRMLFPALGVVLVYFFGFSEQAQLTAAYEALEGAKATAVSRAQILPVQFELEAENEKQAGVKKDKQAMDDRWAKLTSLRSNDPVKRANALRQLTKMLWARGLVPYEEAPEGNQSLPGSFDEMMTKISGANNSSAPAQGKFWRVRFYGRYGDVATTLSMLGQTDLALVPVGLTMSEAHPDTDWRLWTLILWN